MLVLGLEDIRGPADLYMSKSEAAFEPLQDKRRSRPCACLLDLLLDLLTLVTEVLEDPPQQLILGLVVPEPLLEQLPAAKIGGVGAGRGCAVGAFRFTWMCSSSLEDLTGLLDMDVLVRTL